MSKKTGCHTGYKDPIIEYRTKFQEDIDAQKTDALISLKLDVPIHGVSKIKTTCSSYKFSPICISFNKGFTKFDMMLNGSIAKKIWEPLL